MELVEAASNVGSLQGLSGLSLATRYCEQPMSGFSMLLTQHA